MNLGEKIRTRRKELKLSLRELGQKANLTPSYLCDVENGKRGIGSDSLFAVSQVIGMPMDQLMGNDGDRGGVAIVLPASLTLFAGNQDIPFRHALTVYWMMRTIMDHRNPAKRKTLEDVDWPKFYEAVKAWL